MRSGMHALSTNSPYARHGTCARRTACRNMRGTRSCARMRDAFGLVWFTSVPAGGAGGRKGLSDEDSAEGASAQRPGGNVKVFGPSRVYKFTPCQLTSTFFSVLPSTVNSPGLDRCKLLPKSFSTGVASADDPVP